MASVDLNIITGRTGAAHVASEEDAAIWRGLVGNDNVVLFTDNQLALTNNGKQNGVGNLTIAGGVFCIKSGHMGRIGNPKQITYDLPNEGSYRRTLVVIRYTINSTIESMSLLTLQNASANDASSASAAASLSVSTVPSTDYVLYDFVCNSNGIITSTLQTRLTVIDTIPILRAAITNEAAARVAADNTLQTNINTVDGRVTAEATARSNADSTLQSGVNTNAGNITTLQNKVSAKSNVFNISNGRFSLDTEAKQRLNNSALCVFTFSNGATAILNKSGNPGSVTYSDYYTYVVCPASHSNTDCLINAAFESFEIDNIRFYGRWGTSYSVASGSTSELPFSSVRLSFIN